MKHTRGFTLVEVLVSIVILSMFTYLLTSLIGSMKMNASTTTTLTATQAVQGVLERTARKWQMGTYGELAAEDVPPTLQNYNWSVTVCTASTTSDICTSPVTLTPSSIYAYTNTTANLLRVRVDYLPVTEGRARAVSASLEVAKP